MKSANILNQSKKFLLITVGIFALIACKKVNASKGTPVDHIVTETGFTAIDFAVGGDLTYTESASTSIIVNTSDKVFNAMDIRIEGSTLIIGTKKGYNIKNSEEISVTISAPNVNSLACSGSGNLTANIDTTEYASYNLVVSGSGNLKTSAINAINQTFTVSGSGNLSTDELNADNLTATISGSGGIKISGGAIVNSKMTVSGSGNYAAFNLSADNVDATISGSGKAEVTAILTLNAVISGSGNVYYKGTPIINVSSSGSGNLINAN